MSEEWIAIEWVRKADFEKMSVPNITIGRTNSPFYKGERYAVRRGGMCLTVKGKWEYEPLPSSRTDAFYRSCRFKTFDAAAAAVAEAGKAEKE